MRVPMVIPMLMMVACDGDPPVTKSGGGRVDAVVAKASKPDLDGFCDVHAEAATARTMVMPALAEPAAAPGPGWRWINVWATWCRPCVEELPMLSGLSERFSADHLPLVMQFISVDASAADVEEFRRSHPGTPASLRIEDAATLPQWLGALGLDAASVLPIHLFVDGDQKLRCVRMGAVDAAHYETVRALVRAG